MFKQNIFKGILTLFILAGSIVTVSAMRTNPPANLDHVLMGNISGTLVEIAVDTQNETLISEYPAETPANFFAITQEDEADLTDDIGLSILQPFTASDSEQSQSGQD